MVIAGLRRSTGFLVASVALVAAISGMLLLDERAAVAHSFLVATEPAQGERLAGPPDALLLEFSEAPDPSSLRVDLRTADGERVEVSEPAVSGFEARVVVAGLSEAVFVVGWEATSAVDGHGSAGEFAFAVGDAAGDVPVPRSASSTDWWGVVASLAFVTGLAVGSGALLLRGSAGSQAGVPGAGVVRAGLLLAMGGAAAAWLGSEGSNWPPVVAAELLAAALLVLALRVGWVWPLGLCLAAAGTWAARSHGATDHGVVGWGVDFAHLAAGALWVGSLVLVVVAGWRSRRAGRPWLPLVAAYARVALGLVVVLGIAGVVGAVQLIPSWADLWHTGYGRLIVAKAALLVVALVVAASGRWWGLRRGRAGRLRSLLGGEGAVVGTAVLLAAALANGAPPLPAATAEQLLGPPPLQGDVVRDAGLAGQLNVDIAYDGTRLDVKAFGPSGAAARSRIDVTVQRPDGSLVDLAPRPCGAGCSTQALALPEGPSTVRVSASAPGWTGGYYEAQLAWPPGPRTPERLAEVVERMRQVPELTLIETTTSGPGSLASPMEVTITGERLMSAEPYAGANLDDVHLVGPDTLVLYLPGERIFATLVLDPEGRIASSRIVTAGHEITREISYPTAGG